MVERPFPRLGPAAVLIGAGVPAALALTHLRVAGPEVRWLLTDALVAVVLLTAAGALRRARGGRGEGNPWGLLVASGVVVAAAAAAQHVAVLAGAPQLGAVLAGAGGLLATAPVYQGLIRWNRVRSASTDPGDWLNGIGGVLGATALANLLLALTAPQLLDQGATVQFALATAAAATVLAASAATVAFVAGLRHDPRVWAVTAAMAGVAVAQAVSVGVPALRDWTGIAWLAAAAVVCAAGLRQPAPTPLALASAASTTAGSLIVLFAGVAILLADRWVVPEDRWVGTWLAVGTVLAACGRVVRLVRELSSLARTRHQALTDELTGAANRRALTAALDAAVEHRGETSLLLVDLDKFKEINDRHGHAVGDELLQHVTAQVGRIVPAGGLLARLGGDEFAVLLGATGQAGALAVAEQLVAVVRPPLRSGRHLLKVGASVGVATMAGPGDHGGELLRRADAAMYQAKGRGGGVAVYDDALDAAAQERRMLLEDLHVALDGRHDGQFVVYYQPQLRARTNEVTGAEALVRWRHPRLGLLGPDRFLYLVEETNLMGRLTELVLLQAAREAVRWRAQGFGMRISVNVSASVLRRGELLVLLDEALARGLPPQDLVLEITETSLMTYPEESLAAAHAVAARGVGLSIDDYGTGYSSLSYLNDLPARELKIDRSFTCRVLRDERTAAIVAATVELAHRLGMRLVAEGVEDEATHLLLEHLGVDELQGYLHSRPLPAADLLPWLRRVSRAPASV